MIIDRTTPVKGTKDLIQDIMDGTQRYVMEGVVSFNSITITQMIDKIEVTFSKSGIPLFFMETPGVLSTGDALTLGVDLGQMRMVINAD